MRAIAILLLACASTAGAEDRRVDERFYASLQKVAAGCDDPVLDLSPSHVIHADRELKRLMRVLLKVDSARCPGTAEEAVAQLMARIGPSPGAEADLRLLHLAKRAAETGRGMARDYDLADRLGRLLWLFDDDRPALHRLTEEALLQWVLSPEALALLNDRNANYRLRSRRALQLQSEVLLRKGHPAYDPPKAVRLLEDPRIIGHPQARTRLVEVLTSGEHVARDYARAARTWLSLAAGRSSYSEEAQRGLLRLGRAAAGAARTPDEVVKALRIVSASALDGHEESLAEQAVLLRRIGKVGSARLAAAQVDAISEALDQRIAFDLPDSSEDDPAILRPIRLRGLVGPDGRVAATEIAGSSGSPTRDRIVRAAWVTDGEKVDLSDIVKGRFVWVELPEVDPKLTGMMLLERKFERREAEVLGKLAEARKVAVRAEPYEVDRGLAEALEDAVSFYEAEIKYSKAEPILRELIALYPTHRPHALAVERLVYEEWLEKLLRYQGRFDEAKRLEAERVERQASLAAADPAR